MFHLQNQPITEAKLNINTPGSRVDREIDLLFSLVPQEKKISLDIKSPWKKASLSGQMLNTATLKKVRLVR